jgi:hypothetical protein
VPLYHGGRGRRAPGAFVAPGRKPNPWGDTFDDRGRSLYVYATESPGGAAAYRDAIRSLGLPAYVYEVEATGEVIDGGNEIRSKHPFKIVRRLHDQEVDELIADYLT